MINHNSFGLLLILPYIKMIWWLIVEVEAMRKEMYEEMKAQLAINQQMILETNMSFKERVHFTT